MSTPICVFARDHHPVALDEINHLLTTVAQLGPDGRGAWCNGPVGLGHLTLYETPEMRHESQPATLRATVDAGAPANVVISADVRLDNRAELADRLQISPALLPTLDDAQLLLAAYLHWDESFPQHLLGDFAFCIWDGRRHAVICGRDPVGVKPLYIFLQPDLLLAAGDLRALVAHPRGPRHPNLYALGHYLRDAQLTMPGITHLEGVVALLPAHTLTVTADRVEMQRYWFPDRAPEQRFASLEQAAEALAALLDEAVQARLRRVHGVAAHLSGGLDSSSVAVLAARHLRAQGQRLPTFSWQPATDDPAQLATSEYAQLHLLLAQEEFKDSFEHTEVEVTHDNVMADMVQDICLHHSQSFIYEPVVRRAAVARGCRVLLSGWGGDELISFNGRGYLLELFWSGRWAELMRRILARPPAPGKNRMRQVAGALYHQVLKPSLPDFLNRWRLRKNAAPLSPYVACAAPEFAALLAQLPPAPSMLKTFSVRATQLALLNLGHLQARMQSWAAAGAETHLVYRYPLLDRRIIEFALGMPATAYTETQGGRTLFRRAISDLLPAEVCWGNAKLEPLRVHKLLQLTRDALLPSLETLLTRSPALADPAANPKPRMDVAALRQQIAQVQTLDLAASETVSQLAGTMHAVQVLGAGWELPNAAAPSHSVDHKADQRHADPAVRQDG